MDKKTGKLLLTGSTGLVGSRLLPRLMEAGWDCQVLVRDRKKVPSGATAVEGDMLDAMSLKDSVKNVSAIIHLAAVFRSPDNDLIWRSNLEGTRNLIAAAKANIPDVRFILASTSNVYNANNARPGKEDDAVDPQHAYPASKIAAEKALKESGLNWSILRFPFVYGDGDGHIEMLPRHAATAKWHPASRMSMIHHRDIATAMHIALSGKMDNRTVNISDEAPTTIYELIELIGGSMESSSAPLENPWNLQVDIALARSLGFQPTIRTVYEAAQKSIL